MNTPTKLFDKEDTPEWVFIMIVLLTTFAVLSVFCCLAFVLYCKPGINRWRRRIRMSGSSSAGGNRLKTVGNQLTRSPSLDRHVVTEPAGSTAFEMQQYPPAAAPGAAEHGLTRGYSYGGAKRNRQSSRVQNVREILLNPSSLRASASRGLLLNQVHSKHDLKINEELTEVELEEEMSRRSKSDEPPHSSECDGTAHSSKGDETLDSSVAEPEI